MKQVIDPVDIAAGDRLRARRKELGLTQEGVAEALSLTFQQIQKYEKGVNRLSASRIFALSRLLKVEPSYFFQVELGPKVTFLRDEDLVLALNGDKDCIRLNESFQRIASPQVRRKLVALVIALADEATAVETEKPG